MPPDEYEYPVAEWFTGEYAWIPTRMQEGIKKYIIDRVKPGGFLVAVICNDLRNAVAQADKENEQLIALYVRWFHNRAPATCWGSPANYVAWLAKE